MPQFMVFPKSFATLSSCSVNEIIINNLFSAKDNSVTAFSIPRLSSVVCKVGCVMSPPVAPLQLYP